MNCRTPPKDEASGTSWRVEAASWDSPADGSAGALPCQRTTMRAPARESSTASLCCDSTVQPAAGRTTARPTARDPGGFTRPASTAAARGGSNAAPRPTTRTSTAAIAPCRIVSGSGPPGLLSGCRTGPGPVSAVACMSGRLVPAQEPGTGRELPCCCPDASAVTVRQGAGDPRDEGLHREGDLVGDSHELQADLVRVPGLREAGDRRGDRDGPRLELELDPDDVTKGERRHEVGVAAPQPALAEVAQLRAEGRAIDRHLGGAGEGHALTLATFEPRGEGP